MKKSVRNDRGCRSKTTWLYHHQKCRWHDSHVLFLATKYLPRGWYIWNAEMDERDFFLSIPDHITKTFKVKITKGIQSGLPKHKNTITVPRFTSSRFKGSVGFDLILFADIPKIRRRKNNSEQWTLNPFQPWTVTNYLMPDHFTLSSSFRSAIERNQQICRYFNGKLGT